MKVLLRIAKWLNFLVLLFVVMHNYPTGSLAPTLMLSGCVLLLALQELGTKEK